MTPLRIGACLMTGDIADFRDWLFDDDRDIEIQDFIDPAALLGDWREHAERTRKALDGHKGRRGIHGPFLGLDMDTPDPEIAPLVTARFVTAIEAAATLGARQMVLHSPFTPWDRANMPNHRGAAESHRARIHDTLRPVVDKAAQEGVTLVIENIFDPDPATRRALVESFASDAIALSVDTGHAHLAHHTSGAPPVDYFLRDAGEKLAHVHIQDLDGYADRHWPPGEGTILWPSVFKALADCSAQPHLVLEMRHAADIPRGFAHLRDLGLAC